MCKLKSAIILKDRIFMPDYDSHSKMLEELKITDDYFNASKVFVRAELVPENGDVFSDIDGWKLEVDQDITPEWFDEKDCAERMRKAVKEWAKTHIFVGQNGLAISHGENIFIKDCKNVDICGSATVKNIRGNATVEYIRGNATVEDICDEVTVKNICDEVTVEYIRDEVTVENICGNATVKYICDEVTVEYIRGNATVEYICDEVTVEYIRGNATVEYIRGNTTVKNICDEVTVKNICDEVTVEYICDEATVENICGDATVISSPYTKWNNSASLIISGNATFKDCYSKTIYQAGGWKLVEIKKGRRYNETY